MYILMFKQFLRSRTSRLGLLLVLILGAISIMIGKQFLVKQDKISEQVVEQQLEHIERNVEFHSEDLGLLLYYLKFSLVNEGNHLAGLSIGQRDVNPSVLNVNMLTLEGQKYDTDLVNPSQLLYGNLDLSFLFVYVFPLIVIAFTYNLRSEEEESGTWRLVSVMSKSRLAFLLKKLSVRLILLVSLQSLIFVLASFILEIPWGFNTIAFYLISLLYVVFWFALSFWIVSLKRNSNFNALSLLSIWLVLVVMLPAMLNNLMTAKYPVPEAFTTIIKQRDAYHKKWDTEKRPTMEKFYAHYPEFKTYGYPPEQGFSWLWYYAMQDAGDKESRDGSRKMRDKILQRETSSKFWAYFFPSLHTQLSLNELAESNLHNHLEFLSYAEEFHEGIRLYFYPLIFSEEHADKVDWDRFQPTFLSFSQGIDWLRSLLPLIISIFLFLGLALFNMRG
ncbi:MAG: DUF3526 domain-containing protein [Bacteroidota bacterium]